MDKKGGSGWLGNTGKKFFFQWRVIVRMMTMMEKSEKETEQDSGLAGDVTGVSTASSQP